MMLKNETNVVTILRMSEHIEEGHLFQSFIRALFIRTLNMNII